MSKFKVEDRVLVKDDFDFGENAPLGCKLFCLLPHTIEAIDNGMAFLTTIWDFQRNSPTMAYIPLEALIPCDAPIEPTDRKTAFLAELKELLVRNNASIQQDHGCFVVLINDKYVHTIEGGDEYILTADNVMGYDKEEV